MRKSEQRHEHVDDNYHRKNLKQSGSYQFPKGAISHVGSYGINEKDPALDKFEEYQQSSFLRVHRRQQSEMREHRRKRQIHILLFSVIALVVIVVGGFCVFAFGSDDRQDSATVSAAEPIEISKDTTSVSKDSTVSEEKTAESTTTSATETDTDTSYTMVINRTYPISANYIAGTGELMSIEGKQMETNACLALKDMVAALRAAGLDIIIQSAYRSDADQEYLYNRQISRQDGNEIKAATISAVPLTSEHQAGLAVDLSIDGTLTENFGSTAQGQWLKEHCAEYGYILRYPPEKVRYTGIISEPWHFRYVGSVETAQAIMSSGLCMEEYYDKYLADEDIDPYLPYLGLE